MWLSAVIICLLSRSRESGVGPLITCLSSTAPIAAFRKRDKQEKDDVPPERVPQGLSCFSLITLLIGDKIWMHTQFIWIFNISRLFEMYMYLKYFCAVTPTSFPGVYISMFTYPHIQVYHIYTHYHLYLPPHVYSLNTHLYF